MSLNKLVVERLFQQNLMLCQIRLVVCALMTLSLIPVPLHAQEGRVNETAKALHELFASEWDYQMEQHPTWASRLGDRRWNDRWGDRSLGAIGKRHSHNIEVLAKPKAMDREALSPADGSNY